MVNDTVYSMYGARLRFSDRDKRLRDKYICLCFCVCMCFIYIYERPSRKTVDLFVEQGRSTSEKYITRVLLITVYYLFDTLLYKNTLHTCTKREFISEDVYSTQATMRSVQVHKPTTRIRLI